MLEESGDITLTKIWSGLAARAVRLGTGTLWRFFDRHQISRKKTGHAVELERSDILRQRQRWFDGQLDLNSDRLVLIDETRTATNMTRRPGRCPKGERHRNLPRSLS